MQLLTAEKQDLLEAQGFEIAELTGFEQHTLPLYAHRELGDKRPGDVILQVRVGHPDSLDDGEATYLARKAFHGMFPWLPGPDCLKRTFVTVDPDRANDSSSQDKPVKGCSWCRSKRRSGGKSPHKSDRTKTGRRNSNPRS